MPKKVFLFKRACLNSKTTLYYRKDHGISNLIFPTVPILLEASLLLSARKVPYFEKQLRKDSVTENALLEKTIISYRSVLSIGRKSQRAITWNQPNPKENSLGLERGRAHQKSTNPKKNFLGLCQFSGKSIAPLFSCLLVTKGNLQKSIESARDPLNSIKS